MTDGFFTVGIKSAKDMFVSFKYKEILEKSEQF